MKNKQVNKILTTRTGKDLLTLIGPKERQSQREQVLASSGPVETVIYNFWERLLGHDDFGLNDDFFKAGGTSLKAIQLLSRISSHFLVDISLADVFLQPTIAQIAVLVSQKHNIKSLPPLVRVTEKPDRIVLSFGQERLWFIDHLEGTVPYHIPAVLRLTGKLNRNGLAYALQTVIERHESLRSVIFEEQGEPYQQVMSADKWELSITEGSQYKKDNESLEQYVRQLIAKPFNLSKDYMLRATLISLEEQEHVLVVVMHHIASDGWSVPIIVSEVSKAYKSYVEGSPSRLLPLEVQFADFAIWQRDYLRGDLLDSKLAYWKEKLQNVPPLQLPTDFARPAVQSTRGSEIAFTIDAELAAQIRNLGQEQGVTLFMTLLAAFKVLLFRYSGQQDICVGTPVAGRQQEKLESLVGFFVNTIALRSQVNDDIDFIGLLKTIKQTTIEAYEQQELPFEKIVEAVVKDRDLSRSPVFQVMFALQNKPNITGLEWPQLNLSAETLSTNTSKFDFTFFITETDNRLEGSVEYCADLYTAETIRRMIGHYKNLLGSLVEAPHQKLGLLSMLAGDEEQELLEVFNNTKVDYPKNKTVVDLFQEQAAKHPSHIALVFEGQQLTYQQLDERSNQLAHYLQLKGVKEEMAVPILTERGIDMVVGILGILKAGGAYVPIDLAYPQDRINYMLEDTAAGIAICSKALSLGIKSLEAIDVIDIGNDWPLIVQQPVTRLPIPLKQDQLAYIIYTSGSTGNPKGVMLEHGNLYSFISWCRQEFSLSPFNIVYGTTSICFDLSVFELFFPLSIGKPLRIINNGLHIAEYLPNDSLVLINTVPSVLQYLLEEKIDLSNISVINLAGEPIPNYVQQRLDTDNKEVRNLYGPTEYTTYSTVFRLKKGQASLIGKPISNTSIQIVSNKGSLVPIGIPGEILLKGAGLARGYLNNMALTNEKFITDPFDKTGGKIYKTGDIGRWRPDGNLEYIGRIDNQVKVRGFRIELGEIESVLQQYKAVKQVVVLAREDNKYNKYLVGYVVPHGSFDRNGLMDFLKSKVPAYMTPALWVEMENLPLTPNGKIDRQALPEPEAGNLLENSYAPPRDEMENALVDIWQRLLQIQRIGINDNFFELGGHSLLAIRLISAIRRELRVELAIKDLFIHANIASLAALLRLDEKGSLLPSIEAAIRPELIPLSFSQERLWFIDRRKGSIQYHLPSVLRLKGDLDKDALARALQLVVNRHEVLRTVIIEKHGKGYQSVKEHDGWRLHFTDGRAFKENKRALQQYIHEIVDAPFNLSMDYKLRANLITIDPYEHVLVTTMHHIASDGWSTSIIVKELIELYNAFVEGRPSDLAPLKIQYADYAIWQREYLQDDLLESKLGYWKERLKGAHILQLPTDYLRPAVQSTRGANLRFNVDKDLTVQLKLLSQQQGATLFMTLLAAFNVMLYRYSGQQDICVGTPIAGRSHQEVEALIGFFINTLTLRSDLSKNPSFTGLLQQVKITTLEAFANKEVPFAKVAEAVDNERDASRNPLFEVMLTLHNNPDIPELRLGKVSLSEEEYEMRTSQLDIICNITETAHGLEGLVQYCTDLFTEKTVSRMMSHFKQLLVSITRFPQQDINSLPMLNSGEEHELLAAFSNNKKIHANNQTIVSLFEQQVEKTPEATAIIFEETEVSYGELDTKANQFAHYLKKKGVKEETLVPICLERSPEMIIGILGILKAGGAYVPVDPNYPEERIGFMLKDTGATLTVTTDDVIYRLPYSNKYSAVSLDGDWEEINSQPQSRVENTLAPHNLAYVIYTSGSTGKPKGVMVDHKSILSYLLNGKTRYIKSESDSAGSFIHLPYTFDASLTAMFMPLLFGKLVVIGTKRGVNVFEDLNLQKYAPYDFIKITPSHLPLLMPKMKTTEGSLLTNKLVIGGEALFMGQFRHLIDQGLDIEIINEYGPTEASVGCSVFSLHTNDDLAKWEAAIPIGKPIDHAGLLILGPGNELVPIGAIGEICIGGPGLARGYLNLPELTREKFIQNPFSKEDGARLYKTGDLARFLPDGNIQYKGRMDEQVKIRGYRVELEEIESVLQQSELVRKSVVLAKENKEGVKRLVAYIIPEGNFDKEGILEYVKCSLPEHMIPVQWIELDTLPLTSNGKIDRRALPDADSIDDSKHQYAAPRNDCEKVLVSIWQELLNIEKVGIEDNFFELGGDSIISIQLVSRARRAGYELQIEDLFTYQTISRLSDLLDQRLGSMPSSDEQFLLEGASGLLPIQQWYFDKNPVEPSYFNQSALLTVDKRVTETLLKKALEQITAHHDALSFKYYKKDGQWFQAYEHSLKLNRIVTEDVQAASPDELPGLIQEHADHYQRSLDIEKGDLLRVVLMQTPSTEAHNRLLLVIHHLAIDGVSWRILLEDLDQVISELMSGIITGLGAKSTSYRQWYNELENYGQSKRALLQKDYWKEVVAQCQQIAVRDHTEPLKIKDTGHYLMHFGAAQTRHLTHDVPRVYHTEINDILVAALAKAFTEFSNTDKLVIGMEGHGREHIKEGIDTTRTVGWFTAYYPLLLKVNKDTGSDDLLKSIKEQLRQVPDKGLGFGVLKYINRDEALNKQTYWDLSFNYLGQIDNVLTAGQYIGPATESAGENSSPEYEMDANLAINGMVQGGELVLEWTYSHIHYQNDTVIALAQQFRQNLEMLIMHCFEEQKKSGTVFTPSDYGLGREISYNELDIFLNEPFNGKPRKQSLESLYKLSGLQQGILFHGLYDESGLGYSNQFWCDIIDPDLAILRKSWNHLLQSHTSLRSAFYYDSFSIPVQAVYKEIRMPIEVIDYRGMSNDSQAAAIKQFEYLDKAMGFDFKSGPMMRISLHRLDENRYRMLWTFHHIIFDGWSRSIMMGEFLRIYEALVSGKPLPNIKEDRYEDYIRYIEDIDKDKEEEYWKNYLKHLKQNTLLPFIDNIAGRNKGLGDYDSIFLRIDRNKTQQLERYAQDNHITVNTLMQGVWSLLLHHYTGNDDIVFGVVVSGRPDGLSQVEERIGLFINAIPLYAGFSPEQQTVAWLQNLQNEQVASRNFQYTPLPEIQAWTSVQGDLFDSLMVFENYPISQVLSSGKWILEIDNVHTYEQTNYPLSLIVNNTGEISIDFSYNTSLLKKEYVQEISGHFEHVLLQLTENSNGKLSDISLLTAGEQKQLLHEFNFTGISRPSNKTIIDLFEEQAARFPESLALVTDDDYLTYGELSKRSNQLAHYLHKKGIEKNDLVAICINRSVKMIVGILGILKAGAAYVAIDPEYPADRIVYMIEDCEAGVVVSGRDSIDKLPEKLAGSIISLDDDWNDIINEPVENLSLIIRADQLAYVIYTSGSTGKPKGVMIQHSNAYEFICWCISEFAMSRFEIVYAATSICFDLSVFEIFYPLSVGKPVRILKNGLQIGNYVDVDRFVMINTVPSVIQALLKDGINFSNISVINMAGEPITAQIHQSLDTDKIEVRNLYGPTEYTTYSTICRVKNSVPINIGKPVSNTSIYILNQKQELVPVGVKGEICISGAGLSRGYLNRSELTAEKFVLNPFNAESGSKMYRTGDLGRWLPDGNIEYLGRMDEQVKIRGYRIELGEIESTLLQSKLVNKTAVLAKPDKEGNGRLVAYVVTAETFSRETLIGYCKLKLPEYMMPSLWIEMEDLPLTPNGKIDKKALPEPDATELLRDRFVAPRNELEVKLADIWKDILSLKQVGIHDNFFELGGNSLSVMRLISSIRRDLDAELSVKTFFELNTIEELANYIRINQSNYQVEFEDYDTIKL